MSHKINWKICFISWCIVTSTLYKGIDIGNLTMTCWGNTKWTLKCYKRNLKNIFTRCIISSTLYNGIYIGNRTRRRWGNGVSTVTSWNSSVTSFLTKGVGEPVKSFLDSGKVKQSGLTGTCYWLAALSSWGGQNNKLNSSMNWIRQSYLEVLLQSIPACNWYES